MRGHRTIKGQRSAKRAMINEQHSPLPSDPPAGAAIFELRGPAEAAAQTTLSNSALTNTEKERKLCGQSVFYSSIYCRQVVRRVFLQRTKDVLCKT